MMHEARLVRLGAGKAHLGAALHANWVDIEIPWVALRHARTPWLEYWLACKLRVRNSCGNQPEFALLECCTFGRELMVSLERNQRFRLLVGAELNVRLGP